MNSSYNTGSISRMMLVNILLVAFILGAIFVLFFTNEETVTPSPVTSPTPLKAAGLQKSVAPAETDNQAQIDALEKQLESETSKLGTLRANKERVEAIRKAAELEATLAEEVTKQVDSAEDNETEVEKLKADDAATNKATE